MDLRADEALGLEGRVAVTNGASSGIGFACAKALAESGCKLVQNQFWVLPNAELFYPVFDAELAEIKGGISS